MARTKTETSDIDILWNPKLFCPLYWHLLPLLRDPKIRFIYVEGGASAAKTFSILQALFADMWEHQYSTLVFRRFHVHIRDTVYASAKAARSTLGLETYYEAIEDVIRSTVHKSRMVFKGLDNEENIKGVEDFDVVYNNEFNHFTQQMFDQERKRLRGRPNQKFVCDWNPVSAKLWFYENRIDNDEWIDLPLKLKDCPTKWSGLDPDFAFKRINKKGNSVWIKVTYRDNFWVVGHPSGRGGFVDQATLDDFEDDRIKRPNLFRIYGDGLRGIMRTGGEFWHAFNDDKHVGPVAYDDKTVLHIAIDVNVLPYVTISIWQVDTADKLLKQIDELPCRPTDNSNNAPGAARKLVKYLQRMGYSDVVYLYGDPSGDNATTIDEENSSFYDKFRAELGKYFTFTDRVLKSHPPVSISGSFVNELFEYGIDDWTIKIGDKCRESIDDYNSVKGGKNGEMVKEKITETIGGTKREFEKNGHFSDAMRYFITKVLENEFRSFRSKRTKLQGYST